MGNLISFEKRKKRKEKVNQSKKKAQVATKKSKHKMSKSAGFAKRGQQY